MTWWMTIPVLCVLWPALSFAQAVGHAGDFLVANGNAQSIVLIDGATGAQSVVLVGQDLPSGISTNFAGEAVFTDFGGGPSGYSYGRVTRILPGGNWQDIVIPETGAYGCSVDESGNVVYVRSSQIVRYDAATGQTSRTLVVQGLGDPRQLVREPSGTYLLVDRNSYFASPVGDGAVIRLDLATGQAAAVSESGLLKDPTGIAVTANGSIFVADENGGGPGKILRIDPISGAQSVVSAGGLLVDPSSLAIGLDGSLVVSDRTAPGVGCLIRVDPTTGEQTLFSSGGLLVDPRGITLVNGDLPVPASNATWGQVKDRYHH